MTTSPYIINQISWFLDKYKAELKQKLADAIRNEQEAIERRYHAALEVAKAQAEHDYFSVYTDADNKLPLSRNYTSEEKRYISAIREAFFAAVYLYSDSQPEELLIESDTSLKEAFPDLPMRRFMVDMLGLERVEARNDSPRHLWTNKPKQFPYMRMANELEQFFIHGENRKFDLPYAEGLYFGAIPVDMSVVLTHYYYAEPENDYAWRDMLPVIRKYIETSDRFENVDGKWALRWPYLTDDARRIRILYDRGGQLGREAISHYYAEYCKKYNVSNDAAEDFVIRQRRYPILESGGQMWRLRSINLPGYEDAKDAIRIIVAGSPDRQVKFQEILSYFEQHNSPLAPGSIRTYALLVCDTVKVPGSDEPVFVLRTDNMGESLGKVRTRISASTYDDIIEKAITDLGGRATVPQIVAWSKKNGRPLKAPTLYKILPANSDKYTIVKEGNAVFYSLKTQEE